MRNAAMLVFVFGALLAGCARDRNEELWDCQLSVQKENAGKDATAAAERLRAIESCMDERGFRLDAAKTACRNGSVDSACYMAK